jgi:hypothetical protein
VGYKDSWTAPKEVDRAYKYEVIAEAEAIGKRFTREFSDICHYLLDSIEKQFDWTGSPGKMRHYVAEKLLEEYMPMLRASLLVEQLKPMAYEAARQDALSSVEYREKEDKANHEREMLGNKQRAEYKAAYDIACKYEDAKKREEQLNRAIANTQRRKDTIMQTRHKILDGLLDEVMGNLDASGQVESDQLKRWLRDRLEEAGLKRIEITPDELAEISTDRETPESEIAELYGKPEIAPSV